MERSEALHVSPKGQREGGSGIRQESVPVETAAGVPRRRRVGPPRGPSLPAAAVAVPGVPRRRAVPLCTAPAVPGARRPPVGLGGGPAQERGYPAAPRRLRRGGVPP